MAKPYSEIRAAATDGRCHNPIFRKTQLQRLYDAFSRAAHDIQSSMTKDTSHTQAEVSTEFWLAMRLVVQAFDNLDTEKELKDEYGVANGSENPHGREGMGVVVIRPAVAGHAFFFGLVSALVPALAAGNCIIIQMDQTLLRTPKLVLDLVAEALDRDSFHVTSNEVNTADLGVRCAMVVQSNGSRSNVTASNDHFVSDAHASVVAIVERGSDLKAAARALVTARFALRGQSPYAPDLVFVNEWVKKDFLSAVLQEIVSQSTHPAAHVDNAEGSLKLAKGDASQEFSEKARLEAGISVLSSGASGCVVDFQDRKSHHFGKKIHERCLAVHSVTSMDDAIDMATRLGTLGAAYIFAPLPSAKYISQFVDSPTSFVNHVPLDILFNPMASRSNPLVQQGSLFTSYTEALFTTPKSVFVHQRNGSSVLANILSNSASQSAASLLALQKSASSLSNFKRVESRADIGFFNQGIVTGAVMFLSTVLLVSGCGCYYGLKYLKPSVF